MKFEGSFCWEIQGTSHFAAGGNSLVYRAKRPNDLREYAVKHYKLDLEDAGLARFKDEIEIVKLLGDISGCVEYVDHGFLAAKPFYVMPFFENGTLREKYINNNRKYSISEKLQEFLSVLRIVSEVHSRGLAIRDIKPQNILLSDDSTPILADFGLSMWADTLDEDRKTQLNEMIGSQGYRPPEWHSKYPDPNHRPGDIWSLGRTLWAIMAGRNPPNNYETLGSSANHLANHLEKEIANIIQGVISACTSQTPSQRPDIAELIGLTEATYKQLSDKSNTVVHRRDLTEILKHFHTQVSNSNVYIDAARVDSELNIKREQLAESISTLTSRLKEKVAELNVAAPELIGNFRAMSIQNGTAFLATSKLKVKPSNNQSHSSHVGIRFDASAKIQASTKLAYTALNFYLGLTTNDKFYWVVQLGYGPKAPILDEVETKALATVVSQKIPQLDSFIARLMEDIQSHF